MSGPPKKPTHLKLLHGTFRADRANPGEPKPKLEVPEPPANVLNEHAKAEWDRMAKTLFGLGLLSGVDRAALAMYCNAYGYWVTAELKLAVSGPTTVTPNGYEVQSCWFQIRNKAFDQLKKILIEFGMTPASRGRVIADPPEGESDDDDILD